MFIADKWQQYRIIDTCSGEKVEDWNGYILIRPDPQVIWSGDRTKPEWKSAHARYARSSSGGGAWEYSRLPESWLLQYGDLTFRIRPTGFKHTGLFPEQAHNWDMCRKIIEGADRPLSVLNLFAYTGGATMACAKAGARVCHVDAAKGMVAWAKENAALCELSDAHIRYIVDDCRKFVEREIRRGVHYDAVILDPPSFGRGPDGRIWRVESDLFGLIQTIEPLLSDSPLFVLVNAYTTGLSPGVIACVLDRAVRTKRNGYILHDELGLPVQDGYVLPCGSSTYWLSDEGRLLIEDDRGLAEGV